MKKFVSMLLAICMVVICISVLADGENQVFSIRNGVRFDMR